MTNPPRLFSPRCRVLLDNDWAGDPDGLIVLVHHLLSPANMVVAITSSFLDPAHPGSTPTAADGARAASEVLAHVTGADRVAVHPGQEQPFDASVEQTSAASQAIIEEARRPHPLPLYIVCGGPLTNVATALHQAPDIADRMTLIWVGGTFEEVGEYNLDTDRAAASFVLEHSQLAIDQFPSETYRTCIASMAELEADLPATGRLGRQLWQHFIDPPDWGQPGGTWVLGDSPPLLITALSDQSSTWRTARPGAAGTAAHRIFTTVDYRLLHGDLLARLRLHD